MVGEGAQIPYPGYFQTHARRVSSLWKSICTDSQNHRGTRHRQGNSVTQLGKQSLPSSWAVLGEPEPQHCGMATSSYCLFWMCFRFLTAAQLSTEILSCQLGQEVGPILFTSTKTTAHWLVSKPSSWVAATANCTVTTTWMGWLILSWFYWPVVTWSEKVLTLKTLIFSKMNLTWLFEGLQICFCPQLVNYSGQYTFFFPEKIPEIYFEHVD